MQPTKFQGGIEELEGNYFDCTAYGQEDQFIKTVTRIADLVGQTYKRGGPTCTKVMTHASVPTITAPVRPVNTIVRDTQGVLISTTPPQVPLVSVTSYQSEKKLYDSQILNQNENQSKI